VVGLKEVEVLGIVRGGVREAPQPAIVPHVQLTPHNEIEDTRLDPRSETAAPSSTVHPFTWCIVYEGVIVPVPYRAVRGFWPAGRVHWRPPHTADTPHAPTQPHNQSHTNQAQPMLRRHGGLNTPSPPSLHSPSFFSITSAHISYQCEELLPYDA
jgi:hypothetical protein